jgi:DHA1 family tetracycline resistance protein-like MFS transporter
LLRVNIPRAWGFSAAIKPGRIHLPGAPFLLAAGILLSALPVAAVVTRKETV